MLRSLVLALSLIATPAIVSVSAHAEVQPLVAVYPIPADAKAPEVTKGGGGKIRTYNVPRGKTAVVDEARAALKTGKWEVLKDEASPSGNATRIQAKKEGRLWKASYTGDENATVIILTVP